MAPRSCPAVWELVRVAVILSMPSKSHRRCSQSRCVWGFGFPHRVVIAYLAAERAKAMPYPVEKAAGAYLEVPTGYKQEIKEF